jgi:sugar phosphate isomerase/epimerase
MERISRRDAGKLLMAGAAGLLLTRRESHGAERIDSVVRGVPLGAQSYSFRDRDLDACLAGYRAVGLGECELWQGHIEPRGLKGAELTQWRLEAPLRHFEQVRKKFDDAGVHLHAYNYSFRREMSDAEIERGFEMANALGVDILTASSNVSMASRVDKYAAQHRIRVGFHGHDRTDDSDEFSTAETFARALQGVSEYICVNLDIGHFTAAGGDPVAYLEAHHDRIVTLHLKDRKRNHGPNLPFGQGDTPIGPVLRLLRDRGWKIYSNIEYEYGGKTGSLDTIAEMKKCFAYCKQELAA